MSASRKPLLVFLLCGLVFHLYTRSAAQQPKEPEPPSFKIEVEVNKVLVPVVVRDAQHHAVGDLKKEDFRVFDKDKSQIISGVAVEKRAVAVNRAESAHPPPTTPNQPAAT